MEGVVGRHSRSSTRYGAAPVFTGPVRKWKKKWVHLLPSNSSSNSHAQTINPTTNGSNGSHLLLYKWTPITQSQNNNNGDKDSAKEDPIVAATAAEEPPRRKFKYIPIAVLEEQENEAAEKVDEEAKPTDTELITVEPISKSDGPEEKPDINDMPMEESQALDDNNPSGRQDLNETTLDLSLGLAHEDDHSNLKKISD